MIDLTMLILRALAEVADAPLDPMRKREFESELINSIGFGGLRPIRRVFV